MSEPDDSVAGGKAPSEASHQSTRSRIADAMRTYLGKYTSSAMTNLEEDEDGASEAGARVADTHTPNADSTPRGVPDAPYSLRKARVETPKSIEFKEAKQAATRAKADRAAQAKLQAERMADADAEEAQLRERLAQVAEEKRDLEEANALATEAVDIDAAPADGASQASTQVRGLREHLADCGLSQIADAIIEGVGIESVIELSGYSYENLIAAFEADMVLPPKLKTAQVAKLKKLLGSHGEFAGSRGGAKAGAADGAHAGAQAVDELLADGASGGKGVEDAGKNLSKSAAKKARKKAQEHAKKPAHVVDPRALLTGVPEVGEAAASVDEIDPEDGDDDANTYDFPAFLDGVDLVGELLGNLKPEERRGAVACEAVVRALLDAADIAAEPQAEDAADQLEGILLGLDRAHIEWRAREPGLRRARNALVAACSARAGDKGGMPRRSAPTSDAAGLAPSAAAQAQATAQATAVFAAAASSGAGSAGGKKGGDLAAARAKERVKAVAGDDESFARVETLAGKLNAKGESASKNFVSAYREASLKDPKVAALLKTSSMPDKGALLELQISVSGGVMGLGGAAGGASRAAAVAGWVTLIQERFVAALVEGYCARLKNIRQDKAARLVKAIDFGQLVPVAAGTGAFSADELVSSSDGASSTFSKAVLDQVGDAITMMIGMMHPLDCTVTMTLCEVSGAAVGPEGLGDVHPVLYGALFRAWAIMWNDYQRIPRDTQPTLEEAWEVAQTQPEVKIAMSPAVQQQVAKNKQLESMLAALQKTSDDNAKSIASLKQRPPPTRQPPPPAHQPPTAPGAEERPFKVRSAERTAMKEQLFKAKRTAASADSAAKAAADAGRSEAADLGEKAKAEQAKVAALQSQLAQRA